MGTRDLMHMGDRRDFLKAAGAGVVGLGTRPDAAPVGPGDPTPASDTRPTAGPENPTAFNDVARERLKLGVASYSLRNFSRDYVIHAVQSLGTPYINLKSFHQGYDGTPSELVSGRVAFEKAGLQIVGGGTVTLQTDTDEDIRSYFEYARGSGMPLMVIAPSRITLPRIERFVAEYDIQVAVHNHGPEDEYFPGPQDVLPVIKDMDPRVGVCLDVGHTARTGIDVADAAELCGRRLLDVHMKDLADLGDRSSQCVVGEGSMPVARLFDVLQRADYRGFINLEYEIDAFDPLPGMARSFAYMRGVLDGLEA